MAISEDLTVFLNDFGVSCTAGAISALGILDMPSQVISGDMVLTTDYSLTARAADFGGGVGSRLSPTRPAFRHRLRRSCTSSSGIVALRFSMCAVVL
jgi:hypothetical protein